MFSLVVARDERDKQRDKERDKDIYTHTRTGTTESINCWNSY